MAYIVSTAQYSLNAASTNLTLDLPDHATNDVIVFIASMDTGTATATGTTTGAWTDIGNTTATGSTGSARYRKMTSSSEVFQLTTTDSWSLMFICIRDVDQTTALDATPNASNQNTATYSPVNVTVSAANADTLSLYSIGMAQVAGAIHSPPGFMSLGSLDSTGTTATTSANMGVCWYFNRTTGNVPVPTWQSSASDAYIRYTIVLRNASGGKIPPYIDDVSSPAEILSLGHYVGTTAINWGAGNVTNSTTMSPSANINGKTVTGSLESATLSADYGINPYSSAIGNANSTAAATTLIGPNIAFATGRDASTGIICGAYTAGSGTSPYSGPKVAQFGIGNQNQGGGVVRIASGASNWCAYQVLSRDSVPNPEGRYIFGIQASYTTTAYGTPGSAVNTASITSFQSLCNFPSFAGKLLLSELHIVKTQIIAGGDSTTPVSNTGMISIGKSFRLPVIQKQGGSGLISYAPIQIGGGDAVNFQLTGGVLQFPKRYDTTTNELYWHAADNAVGISYYGVSGDTIKHTNSSITSLTPYYWEIHSSATNAATWDFTGLSIYNGTVTLRVAANAGFNQMSFTSCPVLTATSCAIAGSAFNSNPNVAGTSGAFTNCTFTSNTLVTATNGTLTNCTLTSNPTITAGGTTISGTNFTNNTTVTTTTATISDTDFSGNATIALSGSAVTGSTFASLPVGNSTISVDASTSFSSCSFNTSTLTAGNAPIVTTFAIFDGLFANCAFTGSGSGGHAVQVTTTGTTSFVGNTFTGYGADGTTSAAFYNNSGGLITLNISGGGTTPTVRNGAGASTTIVSSVTVTIHVENSSQTAIQNARVYVTRDSDSSVIINESLTDASGNATGSTVSGAGGITIRVRKSSTGATKYIPAQATGSVGASNVTVNITLVDDTIVAATTNATIAGDFTVNTTRKTIKHTADAVVYTANEFYTWLMDYFDDAGLMDDAIPISAQTPSEYTLTNGWFIDDTSTQFLYEGAIQTSGWTHPTNTTGIRILTLATITGVDDSDLGGAVAGVTTGDTGILLAYNTTSKKLWVRSNAAGDLFDNTSENINVSATLAGAMGGSASVSGETIWSNIFTLGTLVSGTTLDVYQNDGQIPPWWTSGQIDVLIKVKEAGTEIDSGYLTVLARKYSTLYDYSVIDASSGRNPVPLAAFTDSNNQTAEGTVGAAPYTNITFDFGYYSGNLNNGNGAQPYDVVINCATLTVAQVYEYLKYVTRTGSATTFTGYGTIPGEFYTGVGDIRLNYTGETSGPFVEGNAITSSAGGSGYITSLIDNGTTGTLVIRNIHGTFADTNTLTSSGTTATINGTPSTITASKQAPFGTFAGGKFFGARGVWITNYAGSDGNNFTLIDSNGTTQVPPSTISITVTSIVSGDRVSVFRTTGDNEIIDKTYISSHATNNSAATTSWQATATIPSDTPATGTIRLRKTATSVEESKDYTSWSGDTFTLSSAHSGGYGTGDSAYVPYIDVTASSTTASVSITYRDIQYVVTRVRKKGIVPFSVKGQITNANVTITAIRTTDSIVV